MVLWASKNVERLYLSASCRKILLACVSVTESLMTEHQASRLVASGVEG